jgi:drug/metabolite transporter (DMT)-like permease
MIYLILCIIINGFIGSIFKWFEKYDIDNFQAIVVNYFVCVVMAGLVAGQLPSLATVMAAPWLGFALITGLGLIVVFNLMGAAVRSAGVGIATVFQKLALIAPALVAIIVYGEKSGPLKWIGIACSIAAIILMSMKNDKGTTTKNSQIWLLPLLTFLGSCLIDLAFFFIDKWGYAPNGDLQFLATLFFIAGSIGLIISLFRKGKPFTIKNIIGGIGLGIPNFFSLYLIILSLQAGLEASIVFPVNNVGVLLLAAAFGMLFFGERFTRRQIMGFLMAISAIILMAISNQWDI